MFLSAEDISVVHTLLDEDLETCGFLYPDGKGVILYIDRVGEEKDGRTICKNSKYTEYIFHTHPIRSKGYPSAEDILKVIKQRRDEYPRVSVIFTMWGIWEITARKKRDLSVDSRLQPWALLYINSEFEPVYFSTGKGRGRLSRESYNLLRQAVENIENTLNRKLRCDLRIKFSTWSEVGDRGYYIKF